MSRYRSPISRISAREWRKRPLPRPAFRGNVVSLAGSAGFSPDAGGPKPVSEYALPLELWRWLGDDTPLRPPFPMAGGQ
ncbi:hypothetical protein PERCYII10_5170 [Pseudomonas aeruginosa]|nr:hypothetical protein PERCYII10_5170 [Pseudomonas aeruginosa]